MQAGKLNRQVTIQKPKTPEAGEPFPTGWDDVTTVWADVKLPSGIQAIKSGIDVSVVKASIRVRYRTDITAAMRVAYDGIMFDIRAVLPDVSGRVYLDLVCESGGNAG
ncbi:phage head closure protein [Alcaligenaceae bacterium]|nr:phage head closure protein [Alcaligenaceae bacterium]